MTTEELEQTLRNLISAHAAALPETSRNTLAQALAECAELFPDHPGRSESEMGRAIEASGLALEAKIELLDSIKAALAGAKPRRTTNGELALRGMLFF